MGPAPSVPASQGGWVQAEGTPELLLELKGSRLTDPSTQAIVLEEVISHLVRVSWLDLLAPVAAGVLPLGDALPHSL